MASKAYLSPSFTGQDGNKRYVTEVVASRVEFLARPGNGANRETGEIQETGESFDLLDDAALNDLF